MAEAKLELEISVKNAAQVKKTLAGITKEQKRGEKEVNRLSQQTDKDRARRQRSRRTILEQDERAIVRMVKRAEQEKIREQKRTAREQEKNQKALKKQAEKDHRDAIKRIKERRAGIARGVAAGALAGGAFVAQRALSLAQAPSIEQRLDFAARFRQRRGQLQTQTGLSDPAIQQLEENILKVSDATLIGSDVLLEGFARAQDAFSNIKFVEDNLQLFAKTSKALGVDFVDLTQTVGAFVQNMDLAEEDVPKAIGALVEAQKQGAITVEGFSSSFGELIPLFKVATGKSGFEGVQSFLGLSEVIAKGQKDPRKARTQTEAVLRTLLTPERAKDLATLAGGKRTEAGRQLLQGTDIDFQTVIAQLATLTPKQLKDRLQPVVGETEAVKGFLTLTEQERKAAGIISRIGTGDVGAGLATVEEGFTRATTGGLANLQRLQLESLNRGVGSLDEFADQINKTAAPIQELRDEFPRLTQALTAAAIAAGAFSLAAGGGSIKGAAGAVKGAGKVLAGVPGALGSGVGAAVAGKSALVVGGALTAAGAVGAGAGTLANKAFDIENNFNDFLAGLGFKGARIAGENPLEGGLIPIEATQAVERSAAANEENADRTEDNTRALNRLAGSIERANAPGQQGDAGVTE